MLDPRRLRTELDVLKKGLARRGVDTSVLDTAAELGPDMDEDAVGDTAGLEVALERLQARRLDPNATKWALERIGKPGNP